MTCVQQCQHRRFRVNIHLYMKRGGRTAGKEKAISFPSTNLPRYFFIHPSGGTVRVYRVKKKEANSSYLIDKLSQINSMWVDRVPMQPCRRWVARKSCHVRQSSCSHSKSQHSSALLSQHASLPIWTQAAYWGRIGRSLKLKNVCSISRNI